MKVTDIEFNKFILTMCFNTIVYWLFLISFLVFNSFDLVNGKGGGKVSICFYGNYNLKYKCLFIIPEFKPLS